MNYGKAKEYLAAMTVGILLVGCGKDYNRDAVSELEAGDTEQSENTQQFDYQQLGVVEYLYPEEFVLEGDLLEAVQIIATERSFDENFIHEDGWKKDFLNLFIYSMYDGPEYEKSINADGRFMTREEVEYIQYSLTGEYLSYKDIPDEIDATDCSYSPMLSYIISDYDYEYDGEYIIVTAEADMYSKGDAGTYKYNLKVTLKPDKYSCFNGYNIVSLEKEEVEQVQFDDGNKHEIIWYCSGEDVDGNLITGEFYEAEDTLFYGMFVTLIVTDEQKEYILNNVPGEFVITYDFDEAGMSYPINEIVPKTVKLNSQ